jgi:hypothetical protein
MKHGVNAFVRTGVGVLGLLVIFMTPEKKERTPGCKTKRDQVALREEGTNGGWGGARGPLTSFVVGNSEIVALSAAL